MKTHRGQIVEVQVRKSEANISELCRQLNISRSSLYNWFENKNLRLEYVYRIGVALNHDFSNEIQELSSEEVKNEMAILENSDTIVNEVGIEVWKDKYVSLLENVKELLEVKKREYKAFTNKIDGTF